MKEQIQFNHDANKLPVAFGTTSDNVASQVTKAIKLFMKDDRSKNSVLGEIVHNNVDYNIILMLATEQIETIAIKSAKASLLDFLTED